MSHQGESGSPEPARPPRSPRVCLLSAEGPTALYYQERHRVDEHTDLMTFAVSGSTKAQVALIAIADRITHVAAILNEAFTDGIHRTFTLAAVQILARPLAFETLAAELQKQQQRPLHERGGTFSPVGSERVLEFLKHYDPAAYSAVQRQLQQRTTGTPAQQLRRDATADAIALTGAATDMKEVPPKEADLIARDASTFLGWQHSFTNTVKVRQFQDEHNRSLKVLISDRDRLETEFGPDLLYYHQQRESFVFVQYKRMTGSGTTMSYSADKQLDQQLKAMSDLDARCSALEVPGPYRLIRTPSFVKICRQESPALEANTMVSGLCMPLEQIKTHLQDIRTISYDLVHNALTSSDFARLVAVGLIGSLPAASAVIREELRRLYGPTVYAEFSDTSNLRPAGRSRTSSRRNPPATTAAPADSEQRSSATQQQLMLEM